VRPRKRSLAPIASWPRRRTPIPIPASEEKFKEVSVAYDVLGDKEKRKEYDEVRRLGPAAAASVAPVVPLVRAPVDSTSRPVTSETWAISSAASSAVDDASAPSAAPILRRHST